MKKILTSLLLLASIGTASAKVINDQEIWVNLNSYIRINDNWTGYLEYQPRFFDDAKYRGVTLYRGAVGRNISNGFSGWLGYGMMEWENRSDSDFPAKYQHEDRIFAQLMHSGFDVGNWKITNRTRYEFRMFRHDDEASERFRHMLTARYKFGDSPWAIALWDEYFYNTNTIRPSSESHAPNINAGFDQNRAFVGVAYFFGEKQQHMFETGYMNNYVNGISADRNAHVWMTTVTGRF